MTSTTSDRGNLGARPNCALNETTRLATTSVDPNILLRSGRENVSIGPPRLVPSINRIVTLSSDTRAGCDGRMIKSKLVAGARGQPMVTALVNGNLCGEICAPTVRVGETKVDRVVPPLGVLSAQDASVSVAHNNPTSLI